MPYGERFYGQTRQKLSYLAIAMRYVWMSKREAFTPKTSVPAIKHGDGSITLWAVLL